MKTYAIRGATTCATNSKEHILEATIQLLNDVLNVNQIESKEIISIIFTVTPDLTQAFPAEAARHMGLTDIALMCAAEIPVADALPKCIRLLLHMQREDDGYKPHFVYLRNAKKLRPDLFLEQE